MNLQDLHKELLALSVLRDKVFAASDSVSRLFAPLTGETGPTREDLDKAVEAFEAKVPGFYVWYSPWEKQYGLFPQQEVRQ